MASMYSNSDLKLKTCPYNNSHKVKASKFQSHISQCGHQYPNIKLKTCEFNASHLIPEDQYSEHLLVCKDSAQFFRSTQFMAKPEMINKIDVEYNTDNRINTRDLWSEEYTTTPEESNMTGNGNLKTYDVLNQREVTAEWLYNQRFGGQEGEAEEDHTFTDSLYVQMMSYEERKKYQSLCVQRIRDIQKRKEEENMRRRSAQTSGRNPLNPPLILTPREGIQRVQTTQLTEMPVPNTQMRVPNTQNPFAMNAIGIGRGVIRRGPYNSQTFPKP